MALGMTMWVKRCGLAIVAVATALLLPTLASAQSSIAGQVTDGTGAVLPGVTIEASSSALIEGSRSAVSDGQGRYIVDSLRPGTYRVTFSLSGFSTLVREGIELSANFTAAVSVQMRVGALTESVTVSGDSPLVDVQRTTAQQVLTRDQMDALPTGRNNWSIGMTLPGISSRTSAGGAVSDVGGIGGGQQAYLTIHGSATADSRIEIDGMDVNSGLGSGQNSSVYFDDGAFQELAFQTVGGTAESIVSGVVVNMIPKDGGNRYSGAGTATYANQSMYSNNYSDDLKAKGLASPSLLKQLWDYNTSIGGPIQGNRLWFFGSTRFWGSDKTLANTFSQPGVSESGEYTYLNKLESYTGRLTAQVSQNHKVSGFYSWMPRRRPFINTSAGLNAAINYSVNGTMKSETLRPYVGQIKWTSTLSSRMLVEGGYSVNHYKFNTFNQDDRQGAIKKVDSILSNQWNAGDGDTTFDSELENYAAKFAYVTGSHSFKSGFQFQRGMSGTTTVRAGDLFQQYQNGKPFQVTVSNTPIESTRANLDGAVGLFFQDQYTMGRLTVNGGVRYDWLRNSVPQQSAGAGRFVPARTFAAVKVPDWSNWSPRVGLAYDVFGNARTALKFSYGRYLSQEVASYAARYNPLGTQTDARTWTDLNGDDIAQNNEIGPSRNAAFGLPAGTVTPDPDLRRAYNDLINVGAQHQLTRTVSISANVFRRDYRNIRWTNNVLVTAADFTQVGIPDPRGNGQTITVYNLAPAKLGVVQNIDQSSDNTMTYNGFDLAVTSRFGQGGTLIAGMSSGLLRTNTCQVPDPNSLRFCDQSDFDIPWDKNYKLSGAYPLPYDIRVSASLQSIPGLPRQITYVVSRTQVPTLTVSSVTIPLNEPGSAFLPRLNQVDLKFSKAIKWGRARLQPELGIFNIANSATYLSQNNVFGPTLDRLQSVLDGRVVRIGVQVNF